MASAAGLRSSHLARGMSRGHRCAHVAPGDWHSLCHADGMDDNTRLRSKASKDHAADSGKGGPPPTTAEKLGRKEASALAGQASEGRGVAAPKPRRRLNKGQDAPRTGGTKRNEPVGRGGSGDRESDGYGGRAPTGPSGRKAATGTTPAKRRSPSSEQGGQSQRKGKPRSGSESNRGARR